MPSGSPGPGTRLGRYEIVELLGRGGMSEVWAAVLHGPQGFRRRVALKLLPAASGYRSVLLREARLGALLSHPNVVATQDLGESDGTLWIAMELVSGATLHELARVSPLTGRALLDAGLHACAALTHVHELEVDGAPARLVHRDLKPSNLILDRSGLVKLADLGIARLLTEPGRVAGTPSYMAPEQHRGEEDARSDVYGLAATLFRLATRDTHRDPAAWTGLDDGTPGLSAVLRRALSPSPDDRPPTARALSEALQALRAAQPPGPTLLERLALVRPDLRPTPGATQDPLSSSAPTVIQAGGPLPRPPDLFVGREAELAQVLDAVLAGGGLWSLLGPGGTGKTRLTLEVAHRVGRTLDGGAWFVDLSEARTADGLLAAVARAFELGLDRSDPYGQIGHAIAGRGRTLVVLDNLEQVVDIAAKPIARWVAAAPECTFLVTSRIALRVDAERRLPLGPLSIPDGVALFEARAPRALDDADRAALPSLIEELDCLPLAIELAAARARLVGVEGLRERMVDRLRLLAGGGRDRPERQRSLRASLDASWELLVPWEQAALAMLSVFEGGFSLEAGDAVLELSEWPDAPWGLDVLERLVEASLLRFERREGRFRMLVSVQAYAAEHLGDREREAAEARHGRWFAQLGTDAWIDGLYGPSAPDRIEHLSRELDNLTAASRRAVARGDRAVARAATRAAVALLRLRGPHGAAAALLQDAHGLLGDAPDGREIRRLQGSVARELGDLDTALVSLRAELERLEADGDPGHADLRLELGLALQERGLHDEAAAIYVEGREHARRTGDRRTESQASGNLGTIAFQRGQLEQARDELHAALAGHRELGSPRFQGIALGNLALIEVAAGRRDAAIAHLRDAATLLERGGDRRSALIVTANLGCLHLEAADPATGRVLLERARDGYREIGARRFEGVVLGQLGTLLSQLGEFEAAERSLRDSLRVHRELGNPISEALAFGNLAHVLLWLGRLDEAERVALDSVGLAREHALPRYETLTSETLAQIWRARGELERAEHWLSLARAALPAGQAECAGVLALGEAQVAEAKGELERAERRAREALGDLERSNTLERARAHVLLARVARARGDEGAAATEIAQARALARPYGPRSAAARELAAWEADPGAREAHTPDA